MSWSRERDAEDDWARLYTSAKNVQNARTVSDWVEAGGVAAAVLAKSGAVYTGICIDTACSLGMCAERNAIAHMLTCGESEIQKLAVIMPDGRMGLPCGACCEFMLQLGDRAGEIEILMDYQKRETRRLKEVFPNWWGRKSDSQ
ncbi:MAG: cytidine deaminase [Lachnospiraceae bacterium]|nr:cytidine deaminase [Lachnospiraceae bacterium]